MTRLVLAVLGGYALLICCGSLYELVQIMGPSARAALAAPI
jgi:hypothetical protein